MKKTLIGLFIAMFSFGSASADAGVNIGVSGAGAIFGATATETDIGPNVTEKNTETEIMGAGYASVFVEKELGPVFVGIDYVMSTLETEEAQRNIRDCGAKADSASCSTGAGYNDKVNKVKVEFEDLTSIYAGVTLFENFYAKVGAMSVDIVTKESLGTGSEYGNTSMDGVVIGIGGKASLPNGMFIRGEANYLEFDAVELIASNAENKVRIDGIDGVAAKISVGASF